MSWFFFFFLMIRRPPGSTLFPHPALFRSHAFNRPRGRFRNFMSHSRHWLEEEGSEDSHGRALWALGTVVGCSKDPGRHSLDRKSTRLNSSHLVISYAVFCLKKKNNQPRTDRMDRPSRPSLTTAEPAHLRLHSPIPSPPPIRGRYGCRSLLSHPSTHSTHMPL